MFVLKVPSNTSQPTNQYVKDSDIPVWLALSSAVSNDVNVVSQLSMSVLCQMVDVHKSAFIPQSAITATVHMDTRSAMITSHVKVSCLLALHCPFQFCGKLYAIFMQQFASVIFSLMIIRIELKVYGLLNENRN